MPLFYSALRVKRRFVTVAVTCWGSLLPKDIISDITDTGMQELNKFGCGHGLHMQGISVDRQAVLQLYAILFSKSGIVLETYHGQRSVADRCIDGGT